MGQAACRSCRCDCERQCTRFLALVFMSCFFGAAVWLCFPFLWANPYEEREPRCSEVAWATALPAVAVSVSCCWGCVFHIGREAPVPTAMSGSFLTVAFLFIAAIFLLIFSSNCQDVDQDFVVSMSLMLLVPMILVCGCACCSCLSSCLSSCGRERLEERAPAPSRAPRVRRAQRILREALILGDVSVADLLLDFKDRNCHGLWRLYRCVFMTFIHCQLRCSCCAGVPEHDGSPTSPASHATPTSRTSVSRASLFFSYEDEDAGEMAIHYLARGKHFEGEGGAGGPSAAAQRCLNWGGQRRTLPELTDDRRARLLRELVHSGRLPFGQLYVVNAYAQTPLHCAASSGSSSMVQELLALVGSQATVVGVVDEAAQHMLRAEDSSGDSPCEAALKNGHVSCASLLVGDLGTWQGLLKLPGQRQALRDCLAGALGQMGPEPPERQKKEKAKLLIHEDTGQLLTHLDQQIRELQTLCGLVFAGNAVQLLPRNACEALLRCHDFDVQRAAAAFRASARDALDQAGLRSLQLRADLSEIKLQELPDATAFSNLCIVCFDEVELQSAMKLSLCRHSVCDTCLAMHIKVRLDEGDVAGVACPEPNCRLPISEEILRRVFGDASAEQARFEQLKTLKLVDMSKNMAWCPAPGCGRVVAWPTQERSETVKTATVVCTCGTSFCFNCKHLTGHEPAPCHPFADFLTDLAAVRQQMQDATNQWLAENSKPCTCGALIQRSGGCNHMICSVCGRHFCYMCGQDWGPHRAQPGGFDYYQCRLPKADGNTTVATRAPLTDGKLSKLQRDCLPGWTANERQPERLKLLFRALLYLAEEFNLGIGIEEPREEGDSAYQSAVSRASHGGRQAAWQALLACLKARKCLQNCYVLKYHWAPEQWRRSRLRTWVPELEGLVGALESALGITLLESQAVKAGFTSQASTSKQFPKHPRDVLRLFDLRLLLPQVIAISEVLGALRQLSRAVSLQTLRILDAGKTGFPELGVLDEAWDRAWTQSYTAQRPRTERCCVM